MLLSEAESVRQSSGRVFAPYQERESKVANRDFLDNRWEIEWYAHLMAVNKTKNAQDHHHHRDSWDLRVNSQAV